jgi:hypothetical protein
MQKTCIQNTTYFIFEFTVSKDESGGKCTISGTMDGSKGSTKSWSTIMHNKSQFRILLANNGVIVDNIPFRPRGDRLTGKIPFKVSFSSQPFNAVFIYYKFSVRG